MRPIPGLIASGGGGGGYAGGGGGGGGGSSFFAGEVTSMEATNDGDGEVFFCVPPTPALTFATSSLDFGNVVVGTSKDVTARLENTGTAPATNLVVRTTSSEFTVDEDATDCTDLGVGDGCTVSVTFTPADVGSAEATLEVDSTEGVTATLDLTGSGVPPPTWTISGTITDASDAPLPNVTVRLTGTTEASATTGDDGTYTFQDLTDGGTYTVTPSLGGYTFNPTFAAFDPLARNEPANFRAAAVELTISGTVVDEDDEPLEGVSVVLSGDSQAEVTTAAGGTFAFDGLTCAGVSLGSATRWLVSAPRGPGCRRSVAVWRQWSDTVPARLRWGRRWLKQCGPRPRSRRTQDPGPTRLRRRTRTMTSRLRHARSEWWFTEGVPLPRTYTLAPQSRRTIWVNAEDAALAETPVAITVQSETPILAERAMWWGITERWEAGHASRGATRPAARWGLAGLALGGAEDAEAYVLIANPNNVDAEATLTLITPAGPRAPVTVPLP